MTLKPLIIFLFVHQKGCLSDSQKKAKVLQLRSKGTEDTELHQTKYQIHECE